MKSILVTALIVSAAIFLLDFARTSSGQNALVCHCVTDAMAEIGKIKVGMKRKDLVKISRNDGGISAINPERFVYEKCDFIKLEVKFKFVDNDSKFPKPNSDDEITEISKPYLEHPFYD